MHSQVINLARD